LRFRHCATEVACTLCHLRQLQVTVTMHGSVPTVPTASVHLHLHHNSLSTCQHTETVALTQVQPSCTPSSQEMIFLVERDGIRPGSQCGCAQLSTRILTQRQQNKVSNKPCRQNSTQGASTSHKPCPQNLSPFCFSPTTTTTTTTKTTTHVDTQIQQCAAFQAFRCQLCGGTAL
jgi:hypothetical protein